MRQFGRNFIRQGVAIAGCALALYGTAQAQRWENAYGGPTTVETARNGVRQVSNGGFVSVGGSLDPALNLEDIYVVRTDNHGGLAWSRTYDIGNNDMATDIEEVPDALGAHDGFIITGYTNHRAGASCGNSQDIFLLRIDRCGAVLWQRTYGATSTDEYAWDVVRATVAGPGVNAGDYIVAGWQGNAPNRDGYLLRVTAGGLPIWGTLYSGPQIDRDDYFYSLDEATIAGVGEIIAAGGTTSYGAVANLDAWLVRVNGNAGVVIVASAYGSGTTTEDLRSVQELTTGGNQGRIVAVGQSTSNATGRDVYVLHTDPVLAILAEVILGFGEDDEGFYVREIPAAAPNLPSTVIVTGYLTPPATWGHGAQDAFLQEFQTGNLALVGNTFVYGDVNNDRGWSVEPVRGNLPCLTDGFIVAGFIQVPSGPPVDPQQLYMFKTNAGKNTNCDSTFTSPTKNPRFAPVRQNPRVSNLTVTCIPPISYIVRTWAQLICALNADGTFPCPLPNCPPPPPQPNPEAEPDFSDRIRMRSGDATYARGTMVMEQ